MNKVLLFILVLTPLLSSAFDLNAAYMHAQNYNADYLGQTEKTIADAELAVQGRAQLLPQIAANGNYSQYYLNTAGVTAYYTQPTVGAGLSQVLVDFNKFSQYSKGKTSSNLSNLQLANAKQQLIVNVAQAYFDVLYATDNLNAIRMNKDAFEQQLNRAKKSFEAGIVAITDVNDAQANYDAALAQEIQAENNLINRKNILHNQTGLNSELIQPLVDQIYLVSPIPSEISEWANMAKASNLNIKIARMQLELAALDIKISKSGHMPILSVNGSYVYQGVPSVSAVNPPGATSITNQFVNFAGFPMSNYAMGSVGLQLSVPIFAGGGINSQVRQAIDNYQVARETLTVVERQTDQNIRNAFYQVKNGMSVVKAQIQALKSAKLKLNADKIGYQVGIRNSINLINSQKNYADTLLKYNQARYQYLTYQLQLEFLSGKINEDFLNLINNNIKQ
jgi:outer membrane protein